MKILGILIMAVLLLSSCKNKCELPENEVGGQIVKDVQISSFPKETFMDVGEGIIIQTQAENEAFADCQVSFNDGESFQIIDFTSYSLIAVKTRTLCSTSFKRFVEIDDFGGFVNYSIDFNSCDEGCDLQVTTYNFALIPKVPNSYEIEVFI